MKELITVEKEIETDGKYCSMNCQGYIYDFSAGCAVFNYELKLESGKALRCEKCLKASGDN